VLDGTVATYIKLVKYNTQRDDFLQMVHLCYTSFQRPYGVDGVHSFWAHFAPVDFIVHIECWTTLENTQMISEM